MAHAGVGLAAGKLLYCGPLYCTVFLHVLVLYYEVLSRKGHVTTLPTFPVHCHTSRNLYKAHICSVTKCLIWNMRVLADTVAFWLAVPVLAMITGPAVLLTR